MKNYIEILCNIDILAKYRNFGENRNLAEKSKFWTKIQILVKNRNFAQKSQKTLMTASYTTDDIANLEVFQGC